MTALISQNLQDALIEQWGHEVLNSHIYAYMMAFLENGGYTNLAKHFSEQHEEEQGHASIILSLLTDLSTPFRVPPIPGYSPEFPTIVDFAQAYLEREIITTNNLDEIKELAMEESNPVVEERIRQMIILQQAEYDEATTFMDKAKVFGADWKSVMLWDAALGD